MVPLARQRTRQRLDAVLLEGDVLRLRRGESRNAVEGNRHGGGIEAGSALRPIDGEQLALDVLEGLELESVAAGFRKNMVDCSPGCPRNRVYGSIRNAMPACRTRSASSSHCRGRSTTP